MVNQCSLRWQIKAWASLREAVRKETMPKSGDKAYVGSSRMAVTDEWAMGVMVRAKASRAWLMTWEQTNISTFWLHPNKQDASTWLEKNPLSS